MRLTDCPWPNIAGCKVVFAVGSIEQHGPHLPLLTDSIIAEAVACEVAKRFGAVLGPTLQVGVSPEHMGFPGTLTLTPKTFKAVVGELAKSLRMHGFKEVIIINGHGGNNRALAGMKGVRVVNLTECLKPYDHAGEVETSLIMHIRPELVDRGRIRKHEFKWPGKKGWEDTREFSKSGVLGDPTTASEEKGRQYLLRLAEAAAERLLGKE